jgi:predicted ArsR family transcriptional regulator
MSNKASSDKNSQKDKEDINEEMLLSDPSVVAILDHEMKQELLMLLIEKELNILEINKITEINPGTIKRHIDSLLQANLIKMTRIESNNWGVKMKFYRATAKRYTVKYSWPD